MLVPFPDSCSPSIDTFLISHNRVGNGVTLGLGTRLAVDSSLADHC